VDGDRACSTKTKIIPAKERTGFGTVPYGTDQQQPNTWGKWGTPGEIDTGGPQSGAKKLDLRPARMLK